MLKMFFLLDFWSEQYLSTYEFTFLSSTLQAMVVWVQRFLKENKKIGPLLEITHPMGFVHKTCVERKVLSSLIYELAKKFAASSFSSSGRRIAFDTLWSFFPNFHAFERHPCAYKDRQVFFKIMCNNMFSTAVSYSYNRMSKNSSK